MVFNKTNLILNERVLYDIECLVKTTLSERAISELFK
jgi:hypothetical protein